MNRFTNDVANRLFGELFGHQPDLGGQVERVDGIQCLERIPEAHFGLAVTIGCGGVDPVDAVIESPLEHLLLPVGIGGGHQFRNRAGPESQYRDIQAGTTKRKSGDHVGKSSH